MQHLIDKIEKICKNTSHFTLDGRHKTKLIAIENIAFTLIDEYAKLYEELILNILSESNYSEKFSEKYIDKKLQSFIAKLVKNNAHKKIIEDNLKLFLKELENFNTRYRVLIPLMGIQMTPNIFDAGNIRLLKGTESIVETIFADIKSIILSTKHTDKTEKRGRARPFLLFSVI